MPNSNISSHTDALKKYAIPIKFDNNRLIPQPVSENIRPSNEILQGRLCDMAQHISEWSTDILDSSKQNKEWMPVNITAELLRSRLNMVLKAMNDYHASLEAASKEVEIEKEHEQSLQEAFANAPPDKVSHMQIPQQSLPFLDSQFASAVAYQQYYPYYYQPQVQQMNERAQMGQQQYMQPPVHQSNPTTPSDVSSQLSPIQMQQMYAQQYAMQQNPIFMMPTYSPEQQPFMPQDNNLINMQSIPPFEPEQIQPLSADTPEITNGDNDFTKMLFDDLEGA